MCAQLLSTQPYKGTRDFYPDDMRLRNWFFGKIRASLELAAFEEYNGPMLESLELYAAKSGEEIATKQTYNFLDKADRSLAIRQSHKNPAITKLYDEYLEKPGSHKAHTLLHTYYTKRDKF